MKIAVIVTDAGQAANCNGGVCVQTVRLFDLPAEISNYIESSEKNIYAAVTFAHVAEVSRG